MYDEQMEAFNNLKRLNFISNGDDYQILFTASPSKNRIIHNTSKILGIKITKIGKINSGSKQNEIIDQKNKQIEIEYEASSSFWRIYSLYWRHNLRQICLEIYG